MLQKKEVKKSFVMITDFQKKVYKILKKVPKGKVTTYGKIAEKLNSSARAVGQALKRNLSAPEVPCHRVVCSDGSLGGYQGKMNSKKKINLLKKEGIIVENNKIKEFEKKLFRF